MSGDIDALHSSSSEVTAALVGRQAPSVSGPTASVIVAMNGLPTVASIPIAALGAAVLALPISLLVLGRRGGDFAVATWVVSDATMLLISSIAATGVERRFGLSLFRSCTACDPGPPARPAGPRSTYRRARRTEIGGTHLVAARATVAGPAREPPAQRDRGGRNPQVA